MSTWAKLANFGSGLEADIVVERLRGSGIPAQARGNDIAGLFGPGFQGTTARGVDVFVPTAQVANARDLLEMDDPTTTSDAAASVPTPHPERALLSALIPGLGQLAQGRHLAAAVQFGTVVAYVVGAAASGSRRALFLALFGNVWSVIDAYRHETD